MSGADHSAVHRRDSVSSKSKHSFAVVVFEDFACDLRSFKNAGAQDGDHKHAIRNARNTITQGAISPKSEQL